MQVPQENVFSDPFAPTPLALGPLGWMTPSVLLVVWLVSVALELKLKCPKW